MTGEPVLISVLALVLTGCTMAPKYERPAAPVSADWPTGPAYAPPPSTQGVAEATGGGLDEVALLTREGTPFCATFEPRLDVQAGDRVEVGLDTRRLHFFDPETEAAILA